MDKTWYLKEAIEEFIKWKASINKYPNPNRYQKTVITRHKNYCFAALWELLRKEKDESPSISRVQYAFEILEKYLT